MMMPQAPWWRGSVVYQMYLRSFRDGNGDGIGDLRGARAGLGYLALLGVDAIWLSPCFPSPQRDHGYDVADYCAVDPLFGDLAEFDLLVEDAHRLGLKIILDIVPNHCSTEHPRFQDALAAEPGSPARSWFHFADGRGAGGQLPPNNWHAMFGGPAWTRVTEPDGRPGQWYLHMFTPHQPDWNWRGDAVPELFDGVLRFWLDRGVDGFRIDVAAGLYKHPELPDSPDPEADERLRDAINPLAWNRPEVHQVWRRWRALCDGYTARDGRERTLVGEVSAPTTADQAAYVRPGELHQAFYFDLLRAPWDAKVFHERIDAALRDIAGVGAPVTWVLNNHDQQRTVTRYAEPDARGGVDGQAAVLHAGARTATVGRATAGPDVTAAPATGLATLDRPGGPAGGADAGRGAARAAAAALMLLALPGSAYLYQGEELGLPEVTDLPAESLSDPIVRGTGHPEATRDGCRVPLPWSGEHAPFGFSTAAADTVWLPQPAWFAEHSVQRLRGDGGSVWHLYRDALRLRRTLAPLRPDTGLRWLQVSAETLVFARDGGFVCAVNFSGEPVPAPVPGAPLLSSRPCDDGMLAPDSTAWWVL